MGQWGHLYGKRWRKRARYQLQVEPLCRRCASEGRLTAASEVIIAQRLGAEMRGLEVTTPEFRKLSSAHARAMKFAAALATKLRLLPRG
jgi:hypothetical protein